MTPPPDDETAVLTGASGPPSRTSPDRLGPPVCGYCGTAGGSYRDHPWCQQCGLWLVLDTTTDEWISHADLECRRRDAGTRLLIADSLADVEAALPGLQAMAPPGWRVERADPSTRARHSVALDPPTGPVQVTGHLYPPASGEPGWTVQVWNRTEGVSFPLYIAGGAHAAHYPAASDALTAALNAIEIEISGAARRPPRF